MAELVQDLAQYIELKGHGTRAATSGWSIFQDGLTDAPDTQIAVIGTGGAASEGQFGTDTLKYEHPRAAIHVRGAREDVAGARTKAFAIYKDVGKIMAETVNGTFYHVALALQPPFLLKADDRARPVFVFNVEAEKEVAA